MSEHQQQHDDWISNQHKQIIVSISDLNKSVDSLEKSVDSLEKSQTETINLITQNSIRQEYMIEKILSAFPNNDPILHRQQHDTQMRASAANEELSITIKKRLFTGVVWGAILLISYAVWEYIRLTIITGLKPPV